MSARVVLAVAAVLAAGLARADDMHKVAPMENVQPSDSGASSSPRHHLDEIGVLVRLASLGGRVVRPCETEDGVGIVFERRAAPYRRGEQPRR